MTLQDYLKQIDEQIRFLEALKEGYVICHDQGLPEQIWKFKAREYAQDKVVKVTSTVCE